MVVSEAMRAAIKKYQDKNKEKEREWNALTQRKKWDSSEEYRQRKRKMNMLNKYDAIYCIRYLFESHKTSGRPRIYI